MYIHHIAVSGVVTVGAYCHRTRVGPRPSRLPGGDAMKVELTHKLEFKADAPPMISELEAMIQTALKDGFPRDTPVYIRAATDDRDHDYTFYASIGKPEEAMQ